MKLSNKLLIFSIALVLLLGLSVTVLVRTTLYRILHDELEKRAQVVTSNLAELIDDYVLIGNILMLQDIIKDYSTSESDIVYIFVLDSEGKVLAHSFQSGFPSDLKKLGVHRGQHTVSRTILSGEDRILDIEAPIIYGEAGAVHMGFDKAPFINRLDIMVRAIMAVVLAVLLAGGAIAGVFSRTITRPVLRLTDYAEKVAAGDLDISVEVAGKDEIGKLSRSFSVMVSELRNSHYELARINKELNLRITQLKQTQSELMEANSTAENERRKTESIIAGIGDGISIQDLGYRILFQNKAHRDLMGDQIGNLCHLAYENSESICEGCPVKMSFEDGGIHTEERSIEGSDGTRYFETTASPLRDSTGNIIAGIEVVRDITERKHIEERLSHTQKMEAIGKLTGGISHEFNNILTSILGFGELMESETKSPRMKKYATYIIESAKRAAELTTGLLAYSRRQITRKEVFEINKLLSSLGDILYTLPGDNISLSMDLSDEPLKVNGDKGQIEQVIMNLVTNSVDAMPEGGELSIGSRIVEVGSEEAQRIGNTPGSYVLLSIRDTGVGMQEQVLPQIFEPFYTTKDVGKGTGLGLSIAYGIIRKHNGSIDVNSVPDKETTFFIYLPLVTA
jgi:PAS domain S-box-containing protein